MRSQISNSGQRQGVLRAALAVFSIALAVRIAFIVIAPAPPFHGDMITYEGIAKNIIDGKWYFGWGELPSAHREPLYPLLVAGVYKIAGPSRTAVHYVHALLCAGTCGLLVVLASRLVRSYRAAVLAGALAAFYPPFLLQLQTVLTEPLATFLLLIATYLAVIGWTDGRRGALALGAFFYGLATLTRASSLMYVPLLALLILVFAHGRRRVGARGAVVFLALFLATLSPWTIRNYVVFGRFIPVAVNAGGSFFRGNYDEGTLGSMGSNYHPDMPPEVTAKFKGMDEVDIDRLLMREGIQYVRTHPGTFIKLCALKFTRFWFNVGFADPPSRASIAFAFANGGLLALAIFGVLGSGLVNHKAAAPVYLLVLYYTGLHVLLFATARYSMPLMPYVFAFAAPGLLGALRRLRLAQ